MPTITEAQGEEMVHQIVELGRNPRCPGCNGDNLTWDMKNVEWRDDGELGVDVKCLHCHLEWTETYVLSAALPKGGNDDRL